MTLNTELVWFIQNGQAGQAGYLPLDTAFQFVPSPFTQHPGNTLTDLYLKPTYYAFRKT